MVRWIVIALVVVLAILTPVYLFQLPQEVEHGELKVDEPTRDVGIRNLSDVVELDFPIINDSHQSLRILGFSGGCSPGYCISSDQSEQIVVAPGATHTYTVKVIVRSPGSFEAVAELLTESSVGVRPIMLRVTGCVSSTPILP